MYDRLDYKQTPNGSWEIENREFCILYPFVTGAHYCAYVKISIIKEKIVLTQNGNEQRQ